VGGASLLTVHGNSWQRCEKKLENKSLFTHHNKSVFDRSSLLLNCGTLTFYALWAYPEIEYIFIWSQSLPTEWTTVKLSRRNVKYWVDRSEVESVDQKPQSRSISPYSEFCANSDVSYIVSSILAMSHLLVLLVSYIFTSRHVRKYDVGVILLDSIPYFPILLRGRHSSLAPPTFITIAMQDFIQTYTSH